MSTMQEAGFLWNHLTKYKSLIMTKDITDGGKGAIRLLLIQAFREGYEISFIIVILSFFVLFDTWIIREKVKVMKGS